MTTITHKLIDSSLTYEEYEALISNLLAEGKSTGPKQSEDLTHYSNLNLRRMQRINKTIKIIPELQSAVETLPEKVIALVITEGWCGDAAQNVPVINAISKLSDKIELKLILRDEHLEVMDEFLTNGGRSIPKIIFLNTDTLEVLGTWGPRPQTAQKMMVAFKKQQGGDYKKFAEQVQLWYAKDKTVSMQRELLELLEGIFVV